MRLLNISPRRTQTTGPHEKREAEDVGVGGDERHGGARALEQRIALRVHAGRGAWRLPARLGMRRQGLRILVPLNFSPRSLTALETVMACDVPASVELHLLHVVPDGDLEPSTGELAHDLVELRRVAAEVLRKLVSDEEGAALLGKIERHVWAGQAAEEILRAAARLHADVIVMGMHGREGPTSGPLGPVAEHVIRGAACPVLCVGPRIGAERALASTWRRIICPVDLSEGSRAAMRAAADLAGCLSLDLVLLHVLGGAPAHVDASAELDAWRQEAATRRGAAVVAQLAHGSPAEEILRVARADGSDVVVLGARDHGRPATSLGAIGTAVLQAARCPVLAIPSPSATELHTLPSPA
jgi:nucleotide-binding universal stress UspA family protein